MGRGVGLRGRRLQLKSGLQQPTPHCDLSLKSGVWSACEFSWFCHPSLSSKLHEQRFAIDSIPHPTWGLRDQGPLQKNICLVTHIRISVSEQLPPPSSTNGSTDPGVARVICKPILLDSLHLRLAEAAFKPMTSPAGKTRRRSGGDPGGKGNDDHDCSGIFG